MGELNKLRVAVLATDGFEESELTEPVRALREAGATVDVIAPKAGEIHAFRHHDKSIKVAVDRTLDDAKPQEYDALMLPGGRSCIRYRTSSGTRAQRLCRPC